MKTATFRRLHGFDARSLLLFASLSAGSGLALAQQAPASGRSSNTASTPTAQVASASPVQEAFRRADANHDGVLTPREVERFPAIAEQFSTLDQDKSGALTLQEFSRGVARD